MIRMISIIFEYRELLYALIIKGFKAKYKNSFLGVFWSLLNPLCNVAIFAFIFTTIVKIDIKNYPLYLLCAILPWNFFNSSLTNSVVSIIEDAHFVKNAAFPPEIIPLAVVIVNFINFLIDLFILAVFLLAFGRGLSISWAIVPVLISIEFFLVSGLSILAAGLYVVFRDLNFILNLFLRLFFYFLPVVYSMNFVPAKYLPAYLLNPLAVIIDAFTRILFSRTPLDVSRLMVAFLMSGLTFIVCLGIFRSIRKTMTERL